jgi:hypothetical protein
MDSKTVSFSDIHEYFNAEYDLDLQSYAVDFLHVDIEAMTSNEPSSSLSFTSIDKIKAGSDLDTSTFDNFSLDNTHAPSEGPGMFSMDLVIQKLMDLQLLQRESIENTTILGESKNDSDDKSMDNINENLISNEEPICSKEVDNNKFNPPWTLGAGSITGHDHCSIKPLDTSQPFSGPSLNNENHFGLFDLPAIEIKIDLNDELIIPIQITKKKKKSLKLQVHAVDDLQSQCGNLNLHLDEDKNDQQMNIENDFSEIEDFKKCRFRAMPLDHDALSSRMFDDVENNEMKVSTKIKPSFFSKNSTSCPQPQKSASDFRRHERMNRHESVAIDMAKGIEKYNKWKLFGNILLLWLILPVSLCVLAYGVIPYEYFIYSKSENNQTMSLESYSWRELLQDNHISSSIWGLTLVPWILVMTSAGALSVEAYSSILSEIEFGVIVWEDNPITYLRVSLCAVATSLALESLIFDVFKAGQVRNWLAIILAGSITIFFMLARMTFNSHRAESSVIRKVFWQLIYGIFLLFSVASTGYSVFVILFTQYGTVRSGNIGIFMAFLFPFLRVLLALTVERCPNVRWGYDTDQLCASSTVRLIATAWHGVFLSLIASSASTPQLVTIAVVEGSLQMILIYLISSIPPSESSTESEKTIESCVSGSTLLGKPLDAEPLDRVTLIPDNRKDSKTSLTLHPIHNVKKKGKIRTTEDDSRELRLVSWLGLTWITGTLTPLAYLLCCFIFSIGPNRRLFSSPKYTIERYSGDGVLYLGTMSLKAMAGLNTIWHLNVFQQRLEMFGVWNNDGWDGACMWYFPPATIKDGIRETAIASMLVWKMLAISGAHFLSLVLGYLWFRYGGAVKIKAHPLRPSYRLGKDDVDDMSEISKDLFGFINALIEYHYNIIALATVMTMAVVFSVIFPWYGMNAPF